MSQYDFVTDEMFDRKLEELLDQEQYPLSIPGMYEILSEALNNDIIDILTWEDLPDDEFDYVLEEEAKGMSGAALLAIPGVYEIVSENYNERALAELEDEHDEAVNSLSLGVDDDPNWRQDERGSVKLKPGHPDYVPLSTAAIGIELRDHRAATSQRSDDIDVVLLKLGRAVKELVDAQFVIDHYQLDTIGYNIVGDLQRAIDVIENVKSPLDSELRV